MGQKGGRGMLCTLFGGGLVMRPMCGGPGLVGSTYSKTNFAAKLRVIFR